MHVHEISIFKCCQWNKFEILGGPNQIEELIGLSPQATHLYFCPGPAGQPSELPCGSFRNLTAQALPRTNEMRISKGET